MLIKGERHYLTPRYDIDQFAEMMNQPYNPLSNLIVHKGFNLN